MPSTAATPRVLLVADLDDWVLGEVARQLTDRLAPTLPVTSLISHDAGFAAAYRAGQRSNTVVHFLSPWDFFTWAPYTRLPCVVTLWHMVDWAPFDRHARRIDALLVASRQWHESVAPRVPPGTPVGTMPFGLDTGRFRRRAEARARLLAAHHLPADTLVIGFAGSAWSNECARKGLDRLWDCLRALDAGDRFVLRLAGRGWNRDDLPGPLRSRVVLDGFIPVGDLPDFYSSLDVYLCTSRAEGVPYPVLESMSCEVAVVSTPVGVVPEIIVDGVNGFLLRHEAVVADFLHALARLRADPGLGEAVAAAARRAVVERFDWQRTVDLSACGRAYADALERFAGRSPVERARIAAGGSLGLLLRPLRVRARLRSRLGRLLASDGESRP
jgi:glycosyltransferase involved in cell wall biosynthesis